MIDCMYLVKTDEGYVYVYIYKVNTLKTTKRTQGENAY